MSSCSISYRLEAPDLSSDPVRGDVIAVERLGGYSTLFARAIVWIAGMSDRISTRNGFDMYRLTYHTLGESGDLVEATGLLSLPRSDQAVGVLSWHHGTTVTRNLVPSTPTPDEGILASIAFAGHGYILLAPDYLGFGGSTLDHPYYHRSTAASSIRDFVLAARSVVQTSDLEWPASLYLTGFSQGGYNTMVALEDIESNPLQGVELRAAASIAGPFDLDGFSLPNALKGESASASLYLAYIANSYARIYGEPLDSMIRQPYADRLAEVFSGDMQGEEAIAALPANPRELFTESALAGFESENYGWLGEYMAANKIMNFTPKTPVRLYYGSNDVDVSPQEALSQVERWQLGGLTVIAEDVGPFDHNESVVEAVPRIREWFDSFMGR